MRNRLKSPGVGTAVLAALVVAIVAAPHVPACAKGAHGWWSGLPGLTKEDIQLSQTKARVELTGKPIGTVLVWDNPKSGSSGTVQLVDTFEWESHPCRKVISAFNTTKAQSQTWEFTLCEIKGEWKWPVPPKKL